MPVYAAGHQIEYSWTEQSVFGYTNEDTKQSGETTIFVNEYRPVLLPPPPGKKKRGAGRPFAIFDDYDTPKGVEVMINHVGDCYE